MCVVSMVYDRYQPLIPEPSKWAPSTTTITTGSFELIQQIAELRRLIAEFREAIAAAKTVDRLTGQPDCEDPDKAKLVERVAELERRLDAAEKPKRQRKSRRKTV